MIARAQLLPTAHEVLRSHPIADGAVISEGFPLTHAWFADCFRLFVHADEVVITNEEELAPDASKVLGRPFLPPGLDWPDGYFLEAQLNLGEIARHDPYGLIPERGMLYLFFDPTRKDFLPASPTACRALVHLDQPTGATLRPYPDRTRLPPSYPDRTRQRSSRLRFEAAFSFTNLDTIPRALIAALEDRLGVRHVADLSSTNLFGPPVFWQGEDEISVFHPDWDWERGAPPTDPERVLLFQHDLDDGQAHFWGRRDAIQRGDFSALEVTASVT